MAFVARFLLPSQTLFSTAHGVLLALFLIFLRADFTYAQSTGGVNGRTLDSGDGKALTKGGSWGFDSSFDQMTGGGSNSTTPLDAKAIWTLKGLTDITQPFWAPEDIDFERNDRAVQKAFTIQGANSLSNLVKGSELLPTFLAIKRSLNEFKSYFSYSLQNDGESMTVSKNAQGKKLLELNMEVNVSQGLDPQIKIGKNARFRYDYVNKRPMLEYGFNF